MWIVIILIAVIVIVVVKKKISDGDGKDPQENPEEVIAQSEVASLFATTICSAFNAGGEYFQWMIANSKERMVKLEFTKQGILIQRVEVNRNRLKETGTYNVDSSGIGFGASGYQDLPNGKAVSAFRNYILEEINQNCPYATASTDGYVKLDESAKKSW